MSPNASALNDGWLDAGAFAELPLGGKRVVRYRHFEIAIFHLAAGLFAIKNACPHAGQPLARGSIADCVVTCPGHNWQFHLDSGECLRGDTSCSIRTFPVAVRDERVMVRVG